MQQIQLTHSTSHKLDGKPGGAVIAALSLLPSPALEMETLETPPSWGRLYFAGHNNETRTLRHRLDLRHDDKALQLLMRKYRTTTIPGTEKGTSRESTHHFLLPTYCPLLILATGKLQMIPTTGTAAVLFGLLPLNQHSPNRTDATLYCWAMYKHSQCLHSPITSSYYKERTCHNTSRFTRQIQRAIIM